MKTQFTSSTYSQFQWSYDIFLNFSGEDTPKTFTGNLYSRLCQVGFNTFMRKGDEFISKELEKAIEESRVSIVVFSKNYASSRWCLEELVKILECKENLNQIVVPIFYDVDPSQVRKQTGCFGEALARHKERSSGAQRMDKWTAALTEAADFFGWDLQDGYSFFNSTRHESNFFGSIIKQVQQEVNQTLLDVARYPVGVDSRVEDIELLLQIGVDEVRMVGIYGIGGIGKTTLAKAIYSQIFRHFDSSCFLSDVSSEAKASNGLVKLQEKLLYQILKSKDFKVNSVAEGITIIKERLGSKKVLIVLDDIDRMRQLESLTGERSWFGSGSLIIITTRDEHLLCKLRANERREAKRLDDDEAMQLFSCHAFNSLSPPQEYVELAHDIIRYSGGIPLALVIFGSHMQGRSVEEWRHELKKLRAIPHSDIQKILKLSFDGLGGDTQSVFLDIACAFHGFSPEEVTKILNAIGVFSTSEIATLVKKCLLQSAYPFLKMHDLVRDMGREIVRMESLRGPGRRSRLFNTQEVPPLKGRFDCLNCETDMKCDELSLQQDEPKITGMRQLSLLREVELAFSSGNLMRSTMHYAILQARPSMRSHCQSIHSLIACDESENELFIATNYRYDSCQFFIPCENCNGCRVSSVVYILHLYAEELHGDFTILGGVFEVKSSFCNSSFKFSYSAEHSSPCHAQPCRFHGTLSLSLFIPTKKSPVGLFEVVHCPQKAIFPFKGQRCPVPSKQKKSSSSPYLNSTVARCSSNQRQMLLHFLQPREHSTNVGHERPEVIVDTQTNNQKRRKKPSTPWSAAGSISKEDLVQRYGMRLEEAARSLRVSVSTFKRLCRVHGISRWPSAKKMREDASFSQSTNALLSDLQHKEGSPSLNQNMSGNSETTKENNMTQGRASAEQEQFYRSRLYSDSLSFENPTTNALARIPEPPENGMICEEVRETSISGQDRSSLEREADSMDEMNHFNGQPSEILNYAPERQAVNSVMKESSTGTIEGIEVGYNPSPESVSEKQSYSSPCLDSTVVQHSSNGQQLHFFLTHESGINAGHESPVVVDTQNNNQKTRNKSSSPWSAAGSIYWEDLVQCYGMKRDEAAARLGVSVSTFKRLCREHGLSRWPTAKKMRENASISRSPNALASALQHKDANLSLNQTMPGNGETTNIMTQGKASAKQELTHKSRQYKRRTDTLFFGNPTPNTLARMPQPPEYLMMCEEDRDTSISRQKRRRPEREADSMDEMLHVNEQPSETLNCAPERQAVDSVRKKSSCLTSLNGTIEGIGMGYNPTLESVSGHAVNELDSTCTGVKLSPGSTSTESLNSISSNEDTTQNPKLLFSNLIARPLEDLINPENEASMKKVLSTLADNLSVFSEEQAKQILELKFDFPILVHSWREFSRSQMYSQKFLADLEKIRDPVGTSVKDEECLKVRYGELESKDKELMGQLQSLLKEKIAITEQMHEKFQADKALGFFGRGESC